MDTPLSVALDLTACDAPIPPTFEYYGCGINPAASLVVTQGAPKTGTAMKIQLDNPFGTQTPGSIPRLAVATASDPAFPCGTLIQGWGMSGIGSNGELLIDATSIVAVLKAPPWAGPGFPTTFNVPIPEDCSLVGITLFLQGVLLDPTPGAGVPIGLTRGVKIGLGS